MKMDIALLLQLCDDDFFANVEKHICFINEKRPRLETINFGVAKVMVIYNATKPRLAKTMVFISET